MVTRHSFVIFIVVLSSARSATEISLKVEGFDGTSKQRICNEGLQHFEELDDALPSTCQYLEYTCTNIGQRSEIFVSCEDTSVLDGALPKDFTADSSDGTTITYTVSLTNKEEVKCEGILKWDDTIGKCGCYLDDLSALGVQYVNKEIGKSAIPEEAILLVCDSEMKFPDYTSEKSVICGIDTDLASYSCQTEDELKVFDNKVAHFEGTLTSYVIVDEPFTQELTDFGLCFWLRTKDAVGSIFSLANEDHWNALRFDTHTSHIHFTMVGLHTDHGLVPKIKLVDDFWRFFCASWSSKTGKATVLVRQHGAASHEKFEEILPLSIGKKVKATGGKLALGNLWKEDVVEMGFNSVGSFEGDVMGLTLFNVNVDEDIFNQMFDDCSTVLDQSYVVLSWKDLLGSKNDIKVSATFGQQVCSKGYKYGVTSLDFPYSNPTFMLSNNVQNYAKIENAFSIDLTEFTICTIIKTTVQIGTIFSYVTTASDTGFREEIVLEKHKTHMHFYMAGIDQQVGAVPAIAIDDGRWYTPCYTWDNTGRWRGYLDGVEVTNNATGKLAYTVGKKIAGGGTCYLGILKTFNSFRESRGYGGGITELNLWGKVLTPEQISEMVKRNKVYEDDLLVNWGTLLENKRGDMDVDMIKLCPAPPRLTNGTFTKTGGSVKSTLYEVDDKITYQCEGTTTMEAGSGPEKTCQEVSDTEFNWGPVGEVLCKACGEAELFECPAEKCIDSSLVCDGSEDCADGSDELNCSTKDTYLIVIGVLIALLLLLVPAVFFVRKAKAARTEMLRVKRLLDDWEVKREHLELQEKLGEGAFGKVFKGALLVKPKYDSAIVVAVKELSDIATERDRNMFLEEIRLSKKLGNHPNIVGIVGSIIVYRPYCLILEFVDGGDMLDYLQKNKENPECNITQEDQVFFAWQIANGMEYVSGMNFVHRDLAARNILISTSKQCKVTDFGLARDLYNYDEYQSEGGRLPIKWMSPEAIFELKFTTESDVWSYGVLMYELFSWGGTPYPGIDPSLLRDRLVNGFRMSAPNDTPDFIYSIMLQCWEFKSADRPTFVDIRSNVEQQINQYQPFLEFKEREAAGYINMTATIDMEEAQGPSETCNAAAEPGPSAEGGLEYKNVSFRGGDVVYKNDYEEATPSGAVVTPSAGQQQGKTTAYATVEMVKPSETNGAACEIKPVNVGFVDESGMAELTRSDYMNT